MPLPAIPYPLPAKLPAPLPDGGSLLNEMTALHRNLWDGEDDESALYRERANSMNGEDSESGDWRIDVALNCITMKKRAIDIGGFPLVAHAKPKSMVTKWQFLLRRVDKLTGGEVPFSRTQRILSLSDGRNQRLITAHANVVAGTEDTDDDD